MPPAAAHLDRGPGGERHRLPLPDIEPSDRRARLLAAQGLLAVIEGRDGRQPLEEALSIDPSLQEAFTALAGLAQGRGEYEEAATWLDRVTRADRGYIPYRIGLAATLRGVRSMRVRPGPKIRIARISG